jgi:hypothetical protein
LSGHLLDGDTADVVQVSTRSGSAMFPYGRTSVPAIN